MQAFIEMSTDDRRQICLEAEGKTGLPAASIEKDFWVCWSLRELFTLPGWGEHLTFKGGTSLSKGWQLIQRFSEDIDIVMDRGFLGFGGGRCPETAPSKKQLRVRLKALKEECQQRIHSGLKPALLARLTKELPKQVSWDLVPAAAEEDPDGQTLLFHYPSVMAKDATYLRPVVKIEMGARSDTEPFSSPSIQAYLAETFPEVLVSSPFPVRCLLPERTFWEKAMLLHEETYRPADKTRKTRLARHYYDLWSLIRKGVGARAAADLALFRRTAEHREVYFNWSWMDYTTLRKGSLRLAPLDNQIAEWRQDYEAMRGEMFFGEVPSFEALIQTVRDFEREFNG